MALPPGSFGSTPKDSASMDSESQVGSVGPTWLGNHQYVGVQTWENMKKSSNSRHLDTFGVFSSSRLTAGGYLTLHDQNLEG